ncbi:MAG: aminotransferase class I/II-fold pyridoxal phosphate-dependent enzyme [Verrucomicrobia bacterium]|nr:aminotransferase class I/II-fold pyridoxal phosphate-dependent enzyme [Verrucomicrobiota bacterium]
MNEALTGLIRPLVRALHPYVPGEQPKIKGLVKLNTNENPYPPSPRVLAAVKEAVDGRLRLYPNSTVQPLREKLAKLHGCRPENIIIGNGSDELLALATRAFVEPAQVGVAADMGRRLQRGKAAALSRARPHWATIQYFVPSYSVYPVLTEIHGALHHAVALPADFALPLDRFGGGAGQVFADAALTFVTTPNAPTGRGYSTKDLEALCRELRGVVVLDEAYVDFADENALSLALKYPHVLVARTFSKAYSLCFQRVGYCVGHPELVAALDKIKDSYNVNGLGQVAALATLDDLPYYRANFRRVIAARERVSGELRELGFEVLPSQTNFIFTKPPRFPADAWLRELRARKVLVRWFSPPETRDHLRISIGTEAEMDALLRAARRILKETGGRKARPTTR